MTRLFKAWLVGLLMTSLLASIFVMWLDRPIAIFVHDTFGSRHVPDSLVHSPGLSIPLASAVIFVALGVSAIMGRKFSKLESLILICDISLLAADVIKNQLKFAFGRSWPDSWGPGIPSLIQDNVYGFHFFYSGAPYESFPSGHAAVVAAVMSVVWTLFPKLRAVCAVCIAVADVGLVLLNLHFVSDVVVGTFVGISAGLFTLVLFSACGDVNLLTPTSRRINPS
jgi:membrane-associated phospholipid phosphatase